MKNRTPFLPLCRGHSLACHTKLRLIPKFISDQQTAILKTSLKQEDLSSYLHSRELSSLGAESASPDPSLQTASAKRTSQTSCASLLGCIVQCPVSLQPYSIILHH